MKPYISLLALTILSLSFAQCGDSTASPDEPGSEIDPDKDYTSHWYYSYEAELTIDAAHIGMSDGEFTPYTVCHSSDTLFVANKGGAGHSIILINPKNGRLMRTLRSWHINGEEKSFGSPIEAIVPAGGRLYVAERESRIHVFTLPQLKYVTCIGNGNWNGQVFQAQAIALNDTLLFARDKNSQISIYRIADINPANYQSINRWRRTAANGAANNSFSPQNMIFDSRGRIMVTDHAAKKIRTLDPSLLTETFRNGESIDLQNEEIITGINPKTIALQGHRLYVTGGNNRINVYDRNLGEWVRDFNSVNGFNFSTPERIYAQNDSVLWISDPGRNTLVMTAVFKNEIREYTRIGNDVAKVASARSRSAAAPHENIIVNLRTHEIIRDN